MRIPKRFCLTFVAAATAVAALVAADRGALGGSLDTLASSKVGNFPKSWRPWPTHRDEAEQVYAVAEDGGSRFIKARDDRDLSEQIFYQFDWKADEQPVLSWRWRATELPAGAAENNDATNDSACGVYVLVGNRYKGVAIKYVWSSTLPAGTVVSRRGGDLRIKVLDSGAGSKGKWVKHAVNIPADYETLFGRKLDTKLTGIGILTDGNAVHKPAGCDYSDFAVAAP